MWPRSFYRGSKKTLFVPIRKTFFLVLTKLFKWLLGDGKKSPHCHSNESMTLFKKGGKNHKLKITEIHCV